jgi:hypothetical protein
MKLLGLARLGLAAVVLALWLVTPAHAGPGDAFYDYTSDLHRDCLQAGLGDTSMFGVPLCEVVKVEPLTMAEALRRKLSYRAIAWGKRFPADEDGYFIAKSGEFIPQSWSVPSPDDKFRRCTYPLNHSWSGPPDNRWKVLRDSGTADGLPPTRCFWRPAGK